MVWGGELNLNIMELRIKKGLSQIALAQKLNVARSTVAMWETGKSKPNASKLEELAALFGVSTDYILGVSTEQPTVPPTIPPDDPYHFAERINQLSDENLLALQRYLDFLEASQQNDQPSSDTPAEGR